MKKTKTTEITFETDELCSLEFTIEQGRFIMRSKKEVTVNPREVAFDLLALGDRFDCIDRGRVALVCQARHVFPMHFVKLTEAIIDGTGEMRAGPSGLSVADLSFVKQNYRFAAAEQFICNAEPGDSGADDADVDVLVSGKRIETSDVCAKRPD